MTTTSNNHDDQCERYGEACGCFSRWELTQELATLTAENQRMREALDWGDTTWHQASWAGRETWWKELRRRATDGPKEAK